MSDRNLSDRNAPGAQFSEVNSFGPNASGFNADKSNHFEPSVSRAGALASLLSSAQPVGRLEALTLGAEYLEQVRKLAPAAEMIACLAQPEAQDAQNSWIGRHIEAINGQLRSQLAACEACFYPADRPATTILAAPFAVDLKLDGLCNLAHQPVVLLIDVGRLAPPDWLGVVAHEYAHAVVGSPGHGSRFQQVLTHLCLGLGLPAPPVGSDRAIAGWPPSRPIEQAAAFWRGGATGNSNAS